MKNSIHSFFSFHFSHDFDRINTVLDSWSKYPEVSMTPFISTPQLIKMMDEGLSTIFEWVSEEIAKAEVVIVLIGSKTKERYFVQYEIQQAILQKKPIYGIYIHQIMDKSGNTETQGDSPLPMVCSTYDWISDNGAQNLLDWTKTAIQDPIYEQYPLLSYNITTPPPSLEDFEQAKAHFFKNLKELGYNV